MICGALQTLNEEACEDVLEETEENPELMDGDIPRTFVIHPSPDSSQGEDHQLKNKTFSDASSANMNHMSTNTGDYVEPTIMILEPQNGRLKQQDVLRQLQNESVNGADFEPNI